MSLKEEEPSQNAHGNGAQVESKLTGATWYGISYSLQTTAQMGVLFGHICQTKIRDQIRI